MPAHAIYAVLVISMPFFVTQLVTAKDVADKIDGDIPYGENEIMKKLLIFLNSMNFSDWQDYITIKNETLTIHEVPTLELSSSLFQGDIAEIQPNETAFVSSRVSGCTDVQAQHSHIFSSKKPFLNVTERIGPEEERVSVAWWISAV